MKFPSFLRIAVKHVGGVCELGFDSEGKRVFVGGSEARILLLLSQIFNFSFELVLPLDGEWGTYQDNGNFSGMVGMVHRGEVDMAMCGISITSKRAKAVSFTTPFDIQRMVFATRPPRLKPKFITFLLPFSVEAWYLILFILLFISVSWRLLLSVKHSFIRLLMDTLYNLLKGSVNLKAHNVSDMLLLGNWFVHSCVFTCSYSAVLLSFVTLPLLEDVISDIPQLSEAVLAGSYRCLVFKGTMIVPVMKHSQIEEVSLLAKTIEHKQWFVEPTRQNVRRAIDEGNTAVIANLPFFKDHFQDGVSVSLESFLTVRIGLAMANDFCCKEELNYKMKRILYAGFYEKFRHDARFLGYMGNNDSVSSRFVDTNPLKTEDLIGAFSVLCIGYLLAFVTFFGELLFIEIQRYKMKCY